MITRYGYDVFFTIAAVCVVIVVLALLFVERNHIATLLF